MSGNCVQNTTLESDRILIMEFDNFIGRQKHFLSEKECETVISAMYDKKLNCGIRTDHNKSRSDSCVFLDPDTDLFKTLNRKLFESLKSYIKEYYLPYIDHYKNTNIKIQVSEDDGGFYVWHCEWGRDHRDREIVWMVYLNDDFEGGHTEFKYFDHSEKPEIGKLLLFPAGYTHLHRASPKLKGQKYIITGWFERKTENTFAFFA